MAILIPKFAYRIPRERYSAALLGILAAGAVWLLYLVGILSPVDGLAYDFFHRTFPLTSGVPAVVLLVEWDPDERVLAEDVWLQVLARLERLGAKQVVFTFVPEDAPPRFFQEALRRGTVLIGRPLYPDADDPDVLHVTNLPPTAAGHEVPSGIAHYPTREYGIARLQHAVFEVDGQRLPAVEVAAAQQRLGAAVPHDDYRVGFRGGPGSLPHVPLKALLAEQVVPELVEGRTVLVGMVQPGVPLGMSTPTTTGVQVMSLLEFQGHAVNSLLLDRTIQVLNPISNLLLLMLLTAICGMLYQWLESRTAFWVSLVLTLGCILATLVLFAAARLWLPVVGVVISQMLCLFLVLRQKAILSFLAAKRLVQDMSSALQDRYLPPNFYQAAEHWALLVNFVAQTLDLRRLIFLEALPGQHRVLQVAAFNCGVEEIHEMRRDYHRAPYTDAIAARKPIRLDQGPRPFLKPAGREEFQYLVPLIFAEQLMGFWASGVDPRRVEDAESFEGLLRDYADQIAEMLYRRRNFLSRQSGEPDVVGMPTLSTEETEYRALAQTVAMLERRLHRTERLFAESSIPSISYDLFGRTREVNPAMAAFLRSQGLTPTETSLVNLLTALSGNDLEFARRCLRQILQDKRPIAVSVRSLDQNQHFLLRMYPLVAQKDETDPTPFDVSGICCELIDRTLLFRLYKLKEQLAGRLGINLRNDLAAVELSASLLASDGLSPAERNDMADVIYQKVKRVVDTLSETSEYFGIDVPGETDRLPVDGFHSFQAARQVCEPLAQTQGTGFEVVRPELMSYVLASPAHLQQTFEFILTLLLRDARPHSQVQVQVDETEQAVRYAFRNQGFGLSHDRFQQYLFGDEALASEEYRNLQRGIGWIKSWGGTVEASSKLGEGTAVVVSLPRFA